MKKVYSKEAKQLLDKYQKYNDKMSKSRPKKTSKSLTDDEQRALGWLESIFGQIDGAFNRDENKDIDFAFPLSGVDVTNFNKHKDHLPEPLYDIANQLFTRKKHVEKTKAFRKGVGVGLAEKTEFQTVPRKGKKYIASEGEHDVDHGRESLPIFFETQTKRVLRGLFDLLKIKNNPFKYFSRGEDKMPGAIYQKDKVQQQVTKGVSIQNVGHATQLIQASGMNILTDPVFGPLHPLFYLANTKPGVKPEDLPTIDAIVISHNHRDHVDEKSLKKIAKLFPNVQLFVPKGDKKLFHEFGFKNVVEFDWYEQVTLEKNGKKVELTAVPADHWSGRKGFDAQHSSVSGWIINPKDEGGLFYFAGDSARLSKERTRTISELIYLKLKSKDPKAKQAFYNLQPGGPNYTRKDMRSTHQSAVESLLTSFQISLNLAKLDTELEKDKKARKSARQWLEATSTIFMHQNKYELGPDRFNENLIIFKRIVDTLKEMQENNWTLNEQKEYLKQLAKIQKDKELITSLFGRNKAFIYEGMIEMLDMAHKIWPREKDAALAGKLAQFLEARVHFPKIGARMHRTQQFFPPAGKKSAYQGIPQRIKPKK